MAEEIEAKVTAAYRELGAEEPPRALDEAILAASRNPLAGWRRSARPWTQRWAVPLSLAAVVVLSVTVTLRIQHEAPELPSTAQQQKPAVVAEATREEAAPLKLKPEGQIKSRVRSSEKPDAARAEPKAFADAPAAAAGPATAGRSAAARESSAARNDAARMQAANKAIAEARREMARSAESGSSGSVLSQIEERTSRDAEAAARAPQAGALFAKRPAAQADSAAASAPAAAPAPQPAAKPAPAPASVPTQVAKLAGETPEREFERIAQLRAEGRHDEADKAFLEFRRRYPNFRITEEMLRRVERK